MSDNKFLNVITTITIALSILIASAAGLLFENAQDVMASWKKGIRIMAYISPAAEKTEVKDTRDKIAGLHGVMTISYISREDALNHLKAQMKRQTSLLENLERNPLPAAFEIHMQPSGQSWEKIETLAAQIEAVRIIDDVEYGQAWIGRWTKIFNLFQFIGITMGVLFFMVTIFIISNTIRLALYARREEIEIMRLVGATDSFIKIPSYVAGIIQGGVGGLSGIIILYIAYLVISSNLEQNFATYAVNIKFLSPASVLQIIIYSIFVGWLGCFLSLKQFLKNY